MAPFGQSCLFQGLQVFIDLPDHGISERVCSAIEKHGGLLCVDLPKSNLVVLQHQQQDAYQMSESLCIQSVSWCWVSRSIFAGMKLPLADQMDRPWISPHIPGSHGCKVSLTGFKGSVRQFLANLVSCTGMDLQAHMHLPTVTHLLAENVVCESSAKLEEARRLVVNGCVSVVSLHWLYDSIRCWAVCEAGPYQENPRHSHLTQAAQPSHLNAPRKSARRPASAPAAGNPPDERVCQTLGPGAHLIGKQADNIPLLSYQPALSNADQVTSKLPLSSKAEGPSAKAMQISPQCRFNPAQPELHLLPIHTVPARAMTPATSALQQTAQFTTIHCSSSVNCGPFPTVTVATGASPVTATTALPPKQIKCLDASSIRPSVQQSLLKLTEAIARIPVSALGRDLLGAIDSMQYLPGTFKHSHLDATSAAKVCNLTSENQGGPHEHAPASFIQHLAEIDTSLAALQISSIPPGPAVFSRPAYDGGAAAGPTADLTPSKSAALSAENAHAAMQDSYLALTSSLALLIAASTNHPHKPADEQLLPIGPAATESCAFMQPAHMRSSCCPQQQGNRAGADIAPSRLPAPSMAGSSEHRQHAACHHQSLNVAAATAPSACPDPAAVCESIRPPVMRFLEAFQVPMAASQIAPVSAVQPLVDSQPVSTQSGLRQVQSPTRTSANQTSSSQSRGGNPVSFRSFPNDTPDVCGHTRRPLKRLRRLRDLSPSSPDPSSCRQPKPVIALSGIHGKQQLAAAKMLNQLGVLCCFGLQSHSWSKGITHVIAPALTRTVKLVAGMAAGNWLLGSSFLDACNSSQTMVPEAAHELHCCTSGKIQPGSPAHWRKRRQSCGHGAFYGLHVLLSPAADEEADLGKGDLMSIILAGSGTIVNKGSFSRSVISQTAEAGTEANLAIIPPGMHSREKDKLDQANIPCAGPSFIIEWVTRPWHDVGGHFSTSLESQMRLKGIIAGRSAV